MNLVSPQSKRAWAVTPEIETQRENMTPLTGGRLTTRGGTGDVADTDVK